MQHDEDCIGSGELAAFRTIGGVGLSMSWVGRPIARSTLIHVVENPSAANVIRKIIKQRDRWVISCRRLSTVKPSPIPSES